MIGSDPRVEQAIRAFGMTRKEAEAHVAEMKERARKMAETRNRVPTYWSAELQAFVTIPENEA